ncbi:MAG: hypothetical protein N3H31_07320 [Candidatus Nezhaarchaeota archaeon]|nr:hypothetical protein [Candidatus Nezhaarchaeota archaeon]
MPRRISRALLSLAGKYAVASEVCRRGFYAQVNIKGPDVTAYSEKERKAVWIEVRAKAGREWPAVEGVRDPSTVLVLVDFYGKKAGERPDFYILSQRDWEEYLDKFVKENPRLDRIENSCPVWRDGYRGAVVKAEQVPWCREKWERLVEKLK